MFFHNLILFYNEFCLGAKVNLYIIDDSLLLSSQEIKDVLLKNKIFYFVGFSISEVDSIITKIYSGLE